MSKECHFTPLSPLSMSLLIFVRLVARIQRPLCCICVDILQSLNKYRSSVQKLTFHGIEFARTTRDRQEAAEKKSRVMLYVLLTWQLMAQRELKLRIRIALFGGVYNSNDFQLGSTRLLKAATRPLTYLASKIT